jgi:peptide-methionine (S)-S-oxide reductase
VCTGRTGHAEAVQVVYDPSRVSYEELLQVFWESHNPTGRSRMAWDRGSQYRSAVFTYSPEQQAAAERVKEQLERSGHFRKPVVTEIVPASTFWRAEDYHQQYYQKHGLGACRV